jgi:metallo-beta-lactamase family protein
VEIQFAGAARQVTGSCHLLRVNGRLVVLDCGLFQGRRALSDRANRQLPAPVGEIDAVLLSHAHIDHAGRLPFLVKEGYRGSIWATEATRDLCAFMLMDAAHIQQKDAEHLERQGRPFVPPLYSPGDVTAAMERMVGARYRQPVEVAPGVTATFVDAGHILGSASLVLDCEEGGVRRRVVFSGDIGRRGRAIVRDPEPPAGAEAVIMESTYGNRDHPPLEDERRRLGAIVREAAQRGGKVLIPAFALGRTQEIIYDLHLLTEAKAIPTIPIFIDSPLAVDATSVFEAHPECFDRSEEIVRRARELFRFGLLRYVRDVEDSKALNTLRGPLVIIAASGMAESGRILHHLRYGAPDPRNAIVIVGFQAEHTLGRRIVERQPLIKVFGEEVPLRAKVEVLEGYSAHADRIELTQWLAAVRERSPRLRSVYLVHGEPPAQEALASSLRAQGYDVQIPAEGDRAAL